jgi:hypothetical protein
VNHAARIALIKFFSAALSLTSPIVEASEYDSLIDSTQAAIRKKRSSLKVTTRVQSLGVFNYGGLIANENPVFDVNFTYDRKRWGCMIFKALDIYDAHSSYNFTLAVAYKNIHVSKRITFTPYGGFVLEQERKVADPGSDGVVFLITSCKVAEHVTLEHCARFSNTVINTKEFDWLNRFKALYTREHLDISASAWRNNRVFEKTTYTTLGMSIGYSRVKIAEHVKLNTTLSALMVASMPGEDQSDNRSGLIFTIGATIQ